MKFILTRTTVLLCSLFCLMTICNIANSDGHVQISQEHKKIILKGTISKALGEYESHLKGAVEYLVCGPTGKQYESIIVTEASAKNVYEAIEKLGVKPGTAPGYDEETDAPTPPTGTAFLFSVEWMDGEKPRQVSAEELLINVKTKKPMQPVAWIFSGSRLIPDLDSDDENAVIPYAFMENSIVALNQGDPSALFQNPLPESTQENLYKKNDELLPPLGTPIKLTIEVNRKRHYHVLIDGKVQGVGFRNFTVRNARELGLSGYAKNLANGKVEIVAEGDKLELNALLKAVRKGPRASRVDSVEIKEQDFKGEFDSFVVQY